MPYPKLSSALGLAFGKGEGEPRSSGESRACNCAVPHDTRRARPRGASPGRPGSPPPPPLPCCLAPGRRQQRPTCYRSKAPAGGPLRRGRPPPPALPRAMTPPLAARGSPGLSAQPAGRDAFPLSAFSLVRKEKKKPSITENTSPTLLAIQPPGNKGVCCALSAGLLLGTAGI